MHGLISPPTPGTLQKLEQITPLCACSDSDCCYIQIGFQVASCVRSAPWDMARRTTHGDYYPSRRRPACGASPLQIGPTWPSSSPQPSKHPFPPPIITVNHSDSSVHGLSLWSGVVILLYQPRCARCRYAPTSTAGWALECSQWVRLQKHTDTHPFAKFPVNANRKTKLGSCHGVCSIWSGIGCCKSCQDWEEKCLRAL